MKKLSSEKPASACHLCGSLNINIIPGLESLYTVTSDCKPWRKGLKLCACKTCGSVQKVIDAKWKSDIKKIYAAYSIYHQSGGIEQPTFNQSSGQPTPRSKQLLETVLRRIALPQRGRMLDVGCGQGTLLRTFSALAPEWSLYGQDINAKNKNALLAIPHVKAFYDCPPENIPGAFDFIALLHSIEHILSPAGFLHTLRKKLKRNGVLLLHTANFLKNPFDLIIADHCSHFTLPSLVQLTEKAGFDIQVASSAIIPKEMTVVARRERNLPKTSQQKTMRKISPGRPGNCIKWLQKVSSSARILSRAQTFGIFGTSIAATWLSIELGESVKFFVDEDPARNGKKFMKRPVYDPENVPVNSHVFIALPYTIGRRVKKRMKEKSNHIQYYLPPVLALREKTLAEI